MKKSIFNLIVSILVISALQVNAQSDSTSIVEVKVMPWKTIYYGAFYKHLGLTTFPADIDHIKGFDFKWGYFYTLQVNQTKLANPPQDASSVEYELVKILSKSPATSDMAFEIRLEFKKYLGQGDNKDLIVKKTEDIYTYDEEIDIHIPKDMKAAWNNFLSEGKDVKALFTFQAENGILFRGISK